MVPTTYNQRVKINTYIEITLAIIMKNIVK